MSSSSLSSSSSPPYSFKKLSPCKIPCRKSRTRSSWTDADELRLLNVVLQVAGEDGSGEWVPLLDRILSSLHRDYTKEQVLEKLKGLKRRFQNRSSDAAATQSETPHTRALFKICEKIWGNNSG